MRPSHHDLCAALVDRAARGERLEVVARRVATATVQIAPDDPRRTDTADGWLVGVRSTIGEDCGLAAADSLDEGCLTEVLEEARYARRVAPRRASPEPDAVPDAVPVAVPAALDAPSPPRHLAEAAAREAAGQGPVTVTAGTTHRTVLRHDSTGRWGGYTQTESQLHVRCALPGLGAAQGARIRGIPAELPIDAVVADVERARTTLGAPGVSVPTVDHVWLSPLLTARVVQRLSRAFVRAAGRRPRWEVGELVADGPQRLVLVDDADLVRGADGAAFDDEGVPRRKTVLLDRGRVAGLLGSLAAGPTTGSAHWGGWDSDIVPAIAACRAEPTTGRLAPAAADLRGRVLLAEELRGFRGGLDLSADDIEFELTGALLHEGELVGCARVGVAAKAAKFLGAVGEVLSGTEFYRIQGLYGGSWCRLDGAVVHGDR